MIYDQAGYACQLEAFLFVSKLTCFELSQSALRGFSDGIVITSYIALRSLVERIAHANRIAEALKDIQVVEGAIYEVGDQIVKALYGTRQNWPALAKLDFRNASPKEAEYVKAEFVADESSLKIMTSIDKLGKRVPGARLVYDVLCE
jgi:hypothetical protein